MRIIKVLAIPTIFIYLGMSGLLNLEFFIKCSLIVGSLLIHFYSHCAVGKVFKLEATKIMDRNKISKISELNFCKKIIYCSCGTITNLLVIILSSYSENFYIKYLLFVNIVIVIFNMLPIKPADFGDVLDVILESIFNEEKNSKIKKIIIKLSVFSVLFVGFFQLLLFSNYSILIVGMVVKKFNRFEKRKYKILMNNQTEFV